MQWIRSYLTCHSQVVVVGVILFTSHLWCTARLKLGTNFHQAISATHPHSLMYHFLPYIDGEYLGMYSTFLFLPNEDHSTDKKIHIISYNSYMKDIVDLASYIACRMNQICSSLFPGPIQWFWEWDRSVVDTQHGLQCQKIKKIDSTLSSYMQHHKSGAHYVGQWGHYLCMYSYYFKTMRFVCWMPRYAFTL